MRAHMAQAVHLLMLLQKTGLYPLAVTLLRFNSRILCGQASTQSRHPLHAASSKVSIDFVINPPFKWGSAPNPAATLGEAQLRFLAALRVRAVRANSFHHTSSLLLKYSSIIWPSLMPLSGKVSLRLSHVSTMSRSVAVISSIGGNVSGRL